MHVPGSVVTVRPCSGVLKGYYDVLVDGVAVGYARRGAMTKSWYLYATADAPSAGRLIGGYTVAELRRNVRPHALALVAAS